MRFQAPKWRNPRLTGQGACRALFLLRHSLRGVASGAAGGSLKGVYLGEEWVGMAEE